MPALRAAEYRMRECATLYGARRRLRGVPAREKIRPTSRLYPQGVSPLSASERGRGLGGGGEVRFLLLILIAFALRVYGLDFQSLWADEGTSVALAPRSLVQIARDASHDIHPPLYYWTLHFWVKVAGTGVFAVRALSAFYGTCVVAMTCALGRRWFGTRAAFVAGVAAAVSPFAIHYSQETRMYILVTLFGALSWWAFDGVQDASGDGHRPPWARLAVYWIAALTTIYTHYFGVAIIATQNLIWLLRTGSRLRNTDYGIRNLFANRWIAAQLALAAAYLPWLWYSRETVLNWPATSEPFGPTFLLRDVTRIFSLGPSVPAHWSPWLWGFLILIAVALAEHVLHLTYHVSRIISSGSVGATYHASYYRALLARRITYYTPRTTYATAWLGVPLVLLLTLSLDRPFYDPKFLLPALPAFHLLLGAGADALGRRFRLEWPVTLGAAAFLILAARQPLTNEWTNPSYWRDDYRGIARTIEATAGPEDAIMLLGPGQIEILNYYYDGPLPRYPLPEQRPIDPEATRQRLEQVSRQHDRLYAVLWAQEESDPAGIIEAWLEQNAFKASDRWYGNVRLAIYAFGDLTEQLRPVEASFGSRLVLTRAAVAPTVVPAGDVVRVELEWRAETSLNRRFTAFAQLLDAGDHIVGQRDGPPAPKPTTEWPVGEPQHGRLGVSVLPGTPPGTYRLIVGLYDTETGERLLRANERDSITLTRLEVERPAVPPPVAALDLDTQQRVALGDVTLLGWRFNKLGFDHAPKTPLTPGEPLSAILFWKSEIEAPTLPAVALQLVAPNDEPVTTWEWLPTEGRYPPARWQAGEVVRDPQIRFLPGGVGAGEYRLVLRADSDAIPLGAITVTTPTVGSTTGAGIPTTRTRPSPR